MKKLVTTTSPLEWLKLKSLTTVSVDPHVDQLELPDVAGIGMQSHIDSLGDSLAAPCNNQLICANSIGIHAKEKRVCKS